MLLHWTLGALSKAAAVVVAKPSGHCCRYRCACALNGGWFVGGVCVPAALPGAPQRRSIHSCLSADHGCTHACCSLQ
jgi:hypothetical protein